MRRQRTGRHLSSHRCCHRHRCRRWQAIITSASPVAAVNSVATDADIVIFCSSLLSLWATDINATCCYYDAAMGQVSLAAAVNWTAWLKWRIVAVGAAPFGWLIASRDSTCVHAWIREHCCFLNLLGAEVSKLHKQCRCITRRRFEVWTHYHCRMEIDDTSAVQYLKREYMALKERHLRYWTNLKCGTKIKTFFYVP
jgi:hypothetical protein